jgi:uncharacterized protein
MKERILAAIAAFGERDVQPLLALFSPDVVYRVTGTTAVSGVHRGLDAIMTRLLIPMAALLDTPIRIRVDAVTADTERVAVQGEGTARLRSGALYDNTYCFVFRHADGKVVEVTEYIDTALTGRAFAVPAEEADLLRAMDLNTWEMMRDMARTSRGSELREADGLTLAAVPRGNAFHNMILVHDAVDADTVVAAAAAFHGARGLPFSVWTRAHADAALDTALRARGFTEWFAMPAMALLGDPGTQCAPKGLKIRAARDDAGRRHYAAVTADAYSVYGTPREGVDDLFARLESVCAPHVQGFVGYLADEPVAAAAVYVTHGVAGIGWVGTVQAHWGKRYGEAVTWAAIREGFRRGAAFANLQASPMGRAVYERMGFITPSAYRLLVRPS